MKSNQHIFKRVSSETFPHLKMLKAGAAGMAQLVECLPSKCEALSTAKKKKYKLKIAKILSHVFLYKLNFFLQSPSYGDFSKFKILYSCYVQSTSTLFTLNSFFSLLSPLVTSP
jgi:hypothetical protein